MIKNAANGRWFLFVLSGRAGEVTFGTSTGIRMFIMVDLVVVNCGWMNVEQVEIWLIFLCGVNVRQNGR